MSKKIKIIRNGPYLIRGNVPLDEQEITADEDGQSESWKKTKDIKHKKTYWLCRCGHSKSKPFCDYSHVRAHFDGTETATFDEHEKQAKEYDGPELLLKDAPALCASARFCERASGIWNLTEQSSDEAKKKTAIQEACNCPSGRLVIKDKKTGEIIEPKLKQSISIIQDPQKKVSGPIWNKGKIELESADGKIYEKRNRMTLCRCGHSKNKPFCDGSHIPVGFSDKKESAPKAPSRILSFISSLFRKN